MVNRLRKEESAVKNELEILKGVGMEDMISYDILLKNLEECVCLLVVGKQQTNPNLDDSNVHGVLNFPVICLRQESTRTMRRITEKGLARPPLRPKRSLTSTDFSKTDRTGAGTAVGVFGLKIFLSSTLYYWKSLQIFPI